MNSPYILVCELRCVGYILGYPKTLEEAEAITNQQIEAMERLYAVGIEFADIEMPFPSYKIHPSLEFQMPINVATSVTNGFLNISAVHITEDFDERQWCWERGNGVALFPVEACDWEKNCFATFVPNLCAN